MFITKEYNIQGLSNKYSVCMIINLLCLEETYSYYGPKYLHVHHMISSLFLYMIRLIVFNIDTLSCKIEWSLPYHFKSQLNLLGYCILCESESLYLIRSIHDQNLLIPHTFHHITTTSRKFLYFMLIFIKNILIVLRTVLLPQLPHILHHILLQ